MHGATEIALLSMRPRGEGWSYMEHSCGKEMLLQRHGNNRHRKKDEQPELCYENRQNCLSCSLLFATVGRKKLYKGETYSPMRERGGSHGCLVYTKISTSPHTDYFWFYGIAGILCHWVQALADFGPEIRKSPYVISWCWRVRLSLSVRNVYFWSL